MSPAAGNSEASVRLYRRLLRLYPAPFRWRYGEEMTLVFKEEWARTSELGVRDRILFWLGLARDLGRTLAREWMTASRLAVALVLLVPPVAVFTFTGAPPFLVRLGGCAFLTLAMAGICASLSFPRRISWVAAFLLGLPMGWVLVFASFPPEPGTLVLGMDADFWGSLLWRPQVLWPGSVTALIATAHHYFWRKPRSGVYAARPPFDRAEMAGARVIVAVACGLFLAGGGVGFVVAVAGIANLALTSGFSFCKLRSMWKRYRRFSAF